mmetsp:Transcript_19763/g.47142  ORF Transcript_19763/g.47142 Transcript_19763/m.47142 type:complete len:208 (-) Transcript_19763:494-1117(-)
MSPTRRSSCSASTLDCSVQLTCSSPSAAVSFPARDRRASHKSAWSDSDFFSVSAALSWACNAATFSCTLARFAFFSSSAAFASLNWRLASATFAFLGSTIFTTSAYTSIARHHMHSPLAALETLPTESAVNSGISMYFFSDFSLFGSMLSLSKVSSWSMKSDSPSSFLAVSQSGFLPKRMQHASIVVWTRAGGLEKDLTSVMSPLVS